VNRLKSAFDIDTSNREVYGDHSKETLFARSVKEILPVDLEIPGCPVSKVEVERVFQHLIWEVQGLQAHVLSSRKAGSVPSATG
jgi:coenzyme F420-reducing hydrogenase gamma subunit